MQHLYNKYIHMNAQTEIVCIDALNHIIRNSKSQIKQHQIIHQCLKPHTATVMYHQQHEMIVQEEQERQGKGNKLREEEEPRVGKKDKGMGSRAVVFKQGQIKRAEPTKVTQKKRKPHFFQYKQMEKSSEKPKQETQANMKQNKQNSLFIKLKTQPTQVIPEQPAIFDELRHKKKQENKKHLSSTLPPQQYKKKEQSTNSLHHNLNSSFTYDLNGSFILCSGEKHQKSLRKQFPEAVEVSIGEVEGQRPKSVKLKRGDFCSSIFQSSKLSKISISNSMSNTQSFMKQNDLFNNNHSRQLTSVPFMEVKPGTVYLEEGNNTKLSQESASSKIFHSKVGQKAKFKKYTKTTTCQGSQGEKFFKEEEPISPPRQSKTATGTRNNSRFSRPHTTSRAHRNHQVTVNSSLLVSLIS